MSASAGRRLFAEFLGTALLVILAVGTATLSFGFKFAGSSISAGVVTTAFAFGLVLLALAYTLGPISGCHVNPAVTVGFVVARRMSIIDAVGYWIAQLLGGLVGAVALWGIFEGASSYTKSVGLGTDGWGKSRTRRARRRPQPSMAVHRRPALAYSALFPPETELVEVDVVVGEIIT